jgi:hypothetical protein
MQSIRDTATGALRELLASQPTTAAKVTFAWQVAVGPALARAAIVSWADGTLRVTPRDAAWRREIQRAQHMLAERLGRLLGPDVIRSIVVEESVENPERHPHA